MVTEPTPPPAAPGKTSAVTEPISPPSPDGRGRVFLVVGVVLILAAIGVLVYAFTRGSDEGATPTSDPVGLTTTSVVTSGATEATLIPLDEFGEAAVTITGPDGDTCTACLLLADTDVTRQQGLMEVTDPDLGGFDGMLFGYDEPANGAFWMRNTRLPLSIAYLDEEGAYVSSTDMEPCPDSSADSDCPRYPADEPFTYAVEVPQGGLEELLLVPGSTLQVDPGPCPLR